MCIWVIGLLRTNEHDFLWDIYGRSMEIWCEEMIKCSQMKREERSLPPKKKIKLEFSFFSGKNEDNKSKKILRTMRVPTFQVRYPNG